MPPRPCTTRSAPRSRVTLTFTPTPSPAPPRPVGRCRVPSNPAATRDDESMGHCSGTVVRRQRTIGHDQRRPDGDRRSRPSPITIDAEQVTRGPRRHRPSDSTSRPAGSQNAVTQFASTQTLAVTSQDGNAAGTLSSLFHRTVRRRSPERTPTAAARPWARSPWPNSPTPTGWTAGPDVLHPEPRLGQGSVGPARHQWPRHVAGRCGRWLERRPRHRTH